jgi:hypothetical protein
VAPLACKLYRGFQWLVRLLWVSNRDPYVTAGRRQCHTRLVAPLLGRMPSATNTLSARLTSSVGPCPIRFDTVIVSFLCVCEEGGAAPCTLLGFLAVQFFGLIFISVHLRTGRHRWVVYGNLNFHANGQNPTTVPPEWHRKRFKPLLLRWT